MSRSPPPLDARCREAGSPCVVTRSRSSSATHPLALPGFQSPAGSFAIVESLRVGRRTRRSRRRRAPRAAELLWEHEALAETPDNLAHLLSNWLHRWAAMTMIELVPRCQRPAQPQAKPLPQNRTPPDPKARDSRSICKVREFVSRNPC